VGDRARLAGCLALVAVLFAPVVTFDFVNWDDDIHVYRNALVVDPARTRLIDALTTPELGYPSPLTIATYRVEHALVGLAPWLYHLDNLLLHVALCWLVQHVARRLGLSLLGRMAAMLVFGLHPAVVEPVAWVTGRKDLIAAAFVLAAAGALADKSLARRRKSVLAAIGTMLGWLAKPIASSVPLLALFWTRAVGRRSWRESVITALPSAVVAVPLFFLAIAGQTRVGAIGGTRSVSVVLREAWYALGYHLGLIALVQRPAAKHLVEQPPRFDAAVDLLPIAFAIVVVLVARRLVEARRDAAKAGLLFAALSYLPSSNLIPLVRYLADSYVLLPLAGLSWTLGAIVEATADGLKDRSRAARLACAGGGLVALAVLASSSFAHLATWRNGVALWSDVTATQPASPNVCRLLGNAYNEASAPERALMQYRACADRFGPEMFDTNIAITLVELGRREEARAAFAAVLARHPGDEKALRYLDLLSR
jgi:hypothetical protein